MTYKQALDTLGTNLSTKINSLSDATKIKLKLVISGYVFNMTYMTSSSLDFYLEAIGSYLTIYTWRVKFDNTSAPKHFNSNSNTVVDDSSTTLPSTFVGTWTVYLV